MTKNKLYLFCLLLGINAVCQAQTLSIRPYVNYHHSVSTQTEPVFHSLGSFVTFPFQILIRNDNFTLSNGFEYGIAVDYRFRNDLGVELGIGYFSSMNSPFEHSSDPTRISFKTDWNYSSIVVRPLFSYAVTSGKSAFIGKIGPVFHYASAEFSTFVTDWHISDCVFDSKWSLGYSIGLEYNYRLSDRLHLAVNFGFEQYTFSPNRATVDVFGLTVSQYEIHYVNKIVGEPFSPFNPNQNNWLKEHISFNNIHFGIGIKYNLWKK